MKSAKSRFGIAFRIIISALITFYLGIHGDKPDLIARVVTQPNFYLSLVASFPVTFAIVYWIHWISLVLDENYDWRFKLFKRSLLQALLGLIVPVLFDLLFVTAYTLFNPEHFDSNEFFNIDLPMIAILIAFLNVIYAVRSLLADPRGTAEQQPMNLDQSPTILVHYRKVTKRLDVKQDILYFYLSKPKVMVVTNEREYSLGKGTINEMEQLYCSFGFCRISSRTLVNMSIVKDLVPATTRYNSKLEFFDPSVIPDPDSDDLLVKGEYREKVDAQLAKRNTNQSIPFPA
ncbi:LytTR family DNA-binding domain-containing protein [Pedobacter sp.]